MRPTALLAMQVPELRRTTTLLPNHGRCAVTAQGKATTQLDRAITATGRDAARRPTPRRCV
eukprot:7642990-Pyramimonas_sp.AAC.1